MGYDGADGFPGPPYPTGSESVCTSNKEQWPERLTGTQVGSKSRVE